MPCAPFLCTMLATAVVATTSLHASTLTTLHEFTSTSANYSQSLLLRDKAGNLYGNASGGGPQGTGAVFRLNKAGKYKVLHVFNGTSDGFSPSGNLVRDPQGNLYGTATQGGTNDDGVIFKIAKTGAFSVLYSFGANGTGGGIYPSGGLVRDKNGNFFGTTLQGGAAGDGTVFAFSTDGTETVLYSFSGPDGSGPNSGLLSRGGSFYGTTSGGGASSDGTIFKLAPGNILTTLHSFTGDDGRLPFSGVIAGKKGALFGTVYFGGANDLGGVYELTRKGTFNLLHNFASTEGNRSRAPVVADKAGNLYGTTDYGGSNNHGTVFELSTANTLVPLHVFNGTDGDAPRAGLTIDSDGNLYGTTFDGGTTNDGTIYKIVP